MADHKGANSRLGHVFVSYVRADSKTVDRLATDLRDRGVEVWLDRERIDPGMRWPTVIRAAIENGSFFLACFSNNYASRDKNYMNEELALAIDQLRQYAHDRVWFIPVLLSDCDVPNRSIGGGGTLRDLNWVELFHDWKDGIQKICDVIRPERRTMREVVEEILREPATGPQSYSRVMVQLLYDAGSLDFRTLKKHCLKPPSTEIPFLRAWRRLQDSGILHAQDTGWNPMCRLTPLARSIVDETKET